MTAPTSTTSRIPFINSEGRRGELSGRVESFAVGPVGPTSWVQRLHPLRQIYATDEKRQRASYIATRVHLAPFMVPHRFEGAEGKRPETLPRAKLGYAVGLNKAYLNEVLGHVRSAPVHYNWGTLTSTSDTPETAAPTGEPAKTNWEDATGKGTSWSNYTEGVILEWMCSSPGGFVLVDTNRTPAGESGADQQQAATFRTVIKNIPMSWVEDFGRGEFGYRWIRIAEIEDLRDPIQENDDDGGHKKRHLLYELIASGQTRIRRYDDEGNQIGPTVFQDIRDKQGRGILPLVEYVIGEHPDIPYLGTGLLMGLDDIVIDLFNIMSEMREAFRDAAFGFFKYKGSDYESVHGQLTSGGRLVNIGEDPHSEMEREAADGGEVTTGLELFSMGLKNWTLAAKRRAIEVMEAQSSRSAVSLRAEFVLDLKPLLVIVTETLDEVETKVMQVLAQLNGTSPENSFDLGVRRETNFQMEEEASRIARIVREFLIGLPLPARVVELVTTKWVESLDFVDLDIEGTRELLTESIKGLADSEEEGRKRRTELAIDQAETNLNNERIARVAE